MSPLAQGFVVNWGLLLAISPQGLYVLRQGVRHEHPVCVSTTCLLVDFLLIGAGTLGIGSALAASPRIQPLAIGLSILLLVAYGARAVWLAVRESTKEVLSSGTCGSPLPAIIGALAVSLLDPCVYVDALLLLAGAAASFEAQDRLQFAIGAIAASAMWFYGLGLGGRRVAVLLRSARARTMVDLASAVAVWTVAGTLAADL